MMLLTEDYFLLYKEKKILAKSNSRTEVSLNTSFRNFKALEENWTGKVKAQVHLLNSQAAADLEIFQGFLLHFQLFGRCLCREEKSTPAFCCECLPIPMPLSNSPTKIHLLSRVPQQRNPFSGAPGLAQVHQRFQCNMDKSAEHSPRSSSYGVLVWQ